MLFLRKIKDIHWLMLILVSASIVRILMIMIPTRPWWDATVYLGMARYIESAGLYGVWEFFRPPLWPVLLSPFASLGAAPLELVAKILTMLASLGVIYCTYEIGKKYSSRAGLIAAFCLAGAVPFVTFSIIPMTEIPSLLFVTIAVYLFLNGRIYLAGIFSGLAFLTRFPVGIIILVLGGVLITELFTEGSIKVKVLNFLKQEVFLGLGFLTILIPYAVSNYILYGSVISPLITGSGMITQFLWLYQGDWLFYVITIVTTNPLVIMVPIIVIVYLIKRELFQKAMGDRVMITCLVAAGLFLIYFSSQPHKEFRYIITLYPFLFVLLGIGVDRFLDIFSEKVSVILMSILIVVGSISIVVTVSEKISHRNDQDTVKVYEFYQVLENIPQGTLIITTTPALAAFSPVRILEGYNSWDQLSEVYTNHRFDAEYVAIDTCEVHVCEPGQDATCRDAKEHLFETLSRTSDLIYDNTTELCRQMIYKNHTSR